MDAPHPPTRLRPATPCDFDAIAGIWHAGASLPDVGPPVMPSREELRQRVDVEIATGWDVTVAEAGGELIGFLAIRPREATLNELFVEPGSLGGGVGKALFDHAKASMPDGFTLYTRSSNARASRFYEKAGMVPLRQDVHPRSGDPVIHYGWNWHLPRPD